MYVYIHTERERIYCTYVYIRACVYAYIEYISTHLHIHVCIERERNPKPMI